MVDFSPETRAAVVRCSEKNDLELVDFFLDGNPELINEQDLETGMTALHWAAANRNLKVAQYIFAFQHSKADPWIKDRWGRLAIDLAIETGNQTLIDLFHRKMFPDDYGDDDEPEQQEVTVPLSKPKSRK